METRLFTFELRVNNIWNPVHISVYASSTTEAKRYIYNYMIENISDDFEIMSIEEVPPVEGKIIL